MLEERNMTMEQYRLALHGQSERKIQELKVNLKNEKEVRHEPEVLF